MDPNGVALVTGASRGIGRAVSLELAARGFDVVATIRDPAAGGDLPEIVGGGAGGSIRVEALDVTDPSTTSIPEGLRVLVNNAGVDGENLSIEDTPTSEWRRQFETNVFGLVEITRRAIPVLRAAGGGVIVNVTTSSVVVPMPFYSVYRASKAAVMALGESLRPEVAPFAIQVMDVLPGPIDTDMLAASKEVSAARRTPPYAALARRVDALRVDEPSTRVTDAAAAIVDALLADPPPRRMGCDPMGAGLLAGWSTTPDEEWQTNFQRAFEP